MSWLAPGFLAAGMAGAVAVVVLHLIALHRPPRHPLPTARFIPVAAARAASATRRPTDPWLLLLRALALLLLGAAFARPVLTPHRVPVRELVLVDRTDAAASPAELRDSVSARLGVGDALVLFDSGAHVVDAGAVDSIATHGLVAARGSLAGALVVARRLATTLADSTDSIRVVVVSPFVEETLRDAALGPVRALWPGALQLVRVGASAVEVAATPIQLPGDTDDALVAGVRFAAIATAIPVRLVREQPADSAWSREGNVLLVWPTTRPDGWEDRAAPDTIGALVAGGEVVVATFVRGWTAPAGGRVVARWVDGEPAAVEYPVGEGGGCVRTVGVPLPAGGDITLRGEFGALLRVLTGPCGGARALAPLPRGAAALDSLASGAAGSPATVSVASFRRASDSSPLARWLLAAALVLLLVEWVLRRRAGPSADAGMLPDEGAGLAMGAPPSGAAGDGNAGPGHGSGVA